MRTVYGIGSCDSCRKARKWLVNHSIEHEFHDLRIDGLDFRILERWSDRIGWQKLLNTRSLTWRKIPETDRSGMTKEKAQALMLQHPTLVKRPVLECEGFIALGFSPENYAAIFEESLGGTNT